MPNFASSIFSNLQILDKNQTGFRISAQCLITKNYHDYRIGPVTKPDKRNKATSKKIDNGIRSASCDIVIFLMYGQFEAIWKPNSGCMISKSYIFSNGNLLSYKN